MIHHLRTTGYDYFGLPHSSVRGKRRVCICASPAAVIDMLTGVAHSFGMLLVICLSSINETESQPRSLNLTIVGIKVIRKKNMKSGGVSYLRWGVGSPGPRLSATVIWSAIACRGS